MAFASSFVNDVVNEVQHKPHLVLDSTTERVFKTVIEPYPLLVIDFQEPRIVNSVSKEIYAPSNRMQSLFFLI